MEKITKIKYDKGITLIALVITIIVILILAAISITMLSGDNGILNQAAKAKVKTELASLKEQVEIAVVSYQADIINSRKTLTVSEIVDKLKDDNIIDDNMTFVENSNYKFSYNGYIKDTTGEIVENVKLTDNITSLEIAPNSPKANGTRLIKCIDGKIQPSTSKENWFDITPDEAPYGYKFAYWIDKYDNIYSYTGNRRGWSTVNDNTFIAIYVKENISIVPKICVNSYSTSQTQEGYLSFQTAYEIPSSLNVTSFKDGLLGTSNQSLANNTDFVVDKSYSDVYYKGASHGIADGDHGVYYWNKSSVGTSTWYVRGYVTVNYENGTTETFYSPSIISAHK